MSKDKVRKQASTVMELSEQLIEEVYQKHIEHLVVDQSDEIAKKSLAYISEHPKCCQEFLESHQWPGIKKGIIEEWKDAVISNFYVNDIDHHHQLHLVDIENAQEYVTAAIPSDREDLIALFRYYIGYTNIIAMLVPYKGSYILCPSFYMFEREEHDLEAMEELYERSKENSETIGVCYGKNHYKKQAPRRRSGKMQITDWFLDFMGPLQLKTFDDTTKQDMIQIGISAIMTRLDPSIPSLYEGKKINQVTKKYYAFLCKRRNKYFDQIEVSDEDIQAAFCTSDKAIVKR